MRTWILYPISLFLLLSTVSASRAEERCIPPNSFITKEMTAWSKQPVIFGDLYNIACTKENKPRSTEEIVGVLKSLGIIVINLEKDIDKAAEYYNDVFEKTEQLMSEQMTASLGGAAKVDTKAMFISPYTNYSYFHELDEKRPNFKNPIVILKGNDVVRETLLHETIHFLIWRENSKDKKFTLNDKRHSESSFIATRVAQSSKTLQTCVQKLSPGMTKSLDDIRKCLLASFTHYQDRILWIDKLLGEEIDATQFLIRYTKNLVLSNMENDETYMQAVKIQIDGALTDMAENDGYRFIQNRASEMTSEELIALQKTQAEIARLRNKLKNV